MALRAGFEQLQLVWRPSSPEEDVSPVCPPASGPSPVLGATQRRRPQAKLLEGVREQPGHQPRDDRDERTDAAGYPAAACASRLAAGLLAHRVLGRQEISAARGLGGQTVESHHEP